MSIQAISLKTFINGTKCEIVLKCKWSNLNSDIYFFIIRLMYKLWFIPVHFYYYQYLKSFNKVECTNKCKHFFFNF